ncbi:hypothetical protein ABBQ32_013683 [Trebouxia sp. C0010 RCD-2024]
MHGVAHGSRQGPVLITAQNSWFLWKVACSASCLQEPALFYMILKLALQAEAVPVNKHPAAAARADGHMCSNMLKPYSVHQSELFLTPTFTPAECRVSACTVCKSMDAKCCNAEAAAAGAAGSPCSLRLADAAAAAKS